MTRLPSDWTVTTGPAHSASVAATDAARLVVAWRLP